MIMIVANVMIINASLWMPCDSYIDDDDDGGGGGRGN